MARLKRKISGGPDGTRKLQPAILRTLSDLQLIENINFIISSRHTKSAQDSTPPTKIPTIFLSLSIILLTACASSQHVPRNVLKTIRLQPDHSVPAELHSVLYAVEGAIESQLPVDVQVVTTGEPDNSNACLIQFVSWHEAMGWGAAGNPASVKFEVGTMYPCEIRINERVTDPDTLRLYVTHELGHVILDQTIHNDDPTSIMSNAVEASKLYRFTRRDLHMLELSLQNDRPQTAPLLESGE